MQQLATAQTLAEVPINENFETVEWASIFGKRHAVTTGLTWGYYGGRYGGSLIADGTVTLAANSVNELLVERATGDVMLATSSPSEWEETSTYARLYRITTSASAVTAVEDHRLGAGGLILTSGGGGDAQTADTLAQFADTTSAQLRGVLSDATGTGAAVFAYGAVLVDPTLGEATATTINKVAFAPATGATLVVPDGTTATLPESSADIGFRDIVQNSRSADYTLALTDRGKHIYHPAADTTARTWTIPANASVAFPIGSAITFDNDFGAGAITIAITTDTLVLVGAAGSTGSRTLATGGQCTIVKVTATRWRISGTGLT